ncbi:MAG: hypothetical protein JRE40_01500 [Deltaproteobacteria bacterium]|nr:hypothetical protein [Deltaproteobacteria bacterium]
MPVETRYFRGDQHTVNTLTAYILGIAQSALASSVSTQAASASLEDTLRPNSDVYKGFPASYPAESPVDTHYTDVDDVTADDSSSFIRTGDSSTEVYDRFGKPSFTLPSGKKIAFIRVVCRGYTEYGSTTTRQASFRFGVYIGTSYYMSSYKKTNLAWKTYSQIWARNPATGNAWTETDINNLQIAVGAKSYYDSSWAMWQWAYITQIYLEVYTYEDATVYYSVDILIRHANGEEAYLAMANSAEWSGLISSLYDSPGLKSATVYISGATVSSTDAVVVRVYQKVGAGSWTLVREFITEQLGAQSIDAATWTIYYYLDISVDLSYVYTVFRHGTTTYNSRIEGFSYTPAPPPVARRFYGDGLTLIVS